MSELRTTSATGGQKGVKAQRYDLLPKEGLDAIAELFGYGATKYADHNWRNRYEFSKSIAALERHTQAFKNGETFDNCDEECPYIDEDYCKVHSRIEHLAAVGFHTLVLLTWLRTDGEGPDNEMDDRWPHTLERARREKAQLEADDYGITDVPRFDGSIYAEFPPLPPEWQNIGWLNEEGFSITPLAEWQASVNEMVARFADAVQGSLVSISRTVPEVDMSKVSYGPDLLSKRKAAEDPFSWGPSTVTDLLREALNGAHNRGARD